MRDCVFCFFVLGVPLAMDTASTDRDALAALFRAAGGESWRCKDNWDTDAELARWHGVTVNVDGRVVKISLCLNGLRGTPKVHEACLVVLDVPISISSGECGLAIENCRSFHNCLSLGVVGYRMPASLCLSFCLQPCIFPLHRHTPNRCRLRVCS